MRILQFCNKSPYPPKEGGPIAMNAITNMLIKQGHSVKVLAINTPKYSVNQNTIDEQYRGKTEIELVWVNTCFRIVFALLSLLKNTSYHVERFKSRKLRLRLKELLLENNFDVVIFETVYLAVYADIIRKYSSAKLILRAHNVEHLIWEQIAENTPKGLKKTYLSILSKQLKRFEKEAISLFDAIFCISQTDTLWFSAQNKNIPVETVPFGVDISKLPDDVTPCNCGNLFSLASMDWYPNIEGIEWFLRNVWQQIHHLYPALVFKIAGRNIPDSLKNTSLQNIDIVGEVDDAQKFMLENGILIVPLWSGSGIRIKIIEAMALGKVVITTSIGLEGIAAEDKKHILIADTPQAFVEAVTFCMENPSECEQIGKNARQFIKENHNNEKISAKLEENL
jgi:glycosyltransferase involved in cell wall biosynthesis